MRKLDAFLAALIGFLDGVICFFIIQYLQIKVPYSWLLPFFQHFLILPSVFAFLGVVGIFIASLIGKKIFFVFQAARFFWVGTLNTFIDLGVVYFLIGITNIAKGPLYSVFAAISFLIATTNSYFWNKYWTFSASAQGYGGQGKKVSGKEFGKFFIITTIGLGINVGVASFVVNVIGTQFGLGEKIWAGIGKLVAAFFAFVWNFLGSKFIVFKK